MTKADQEIILHNYPQSPVAEKVRTALGFKGLSWRSVEIPRLPPKPQLTKLTGGYRRTPVMQIGADIYCDSQCIIRELEQRHPSPTFFPTKDAGLIWCLSRWTDGKLFDLGVKIVLGANATDLPQDFLQDRGRLYFGSDWERNLQSAHSNLPHLLSQMRAPLSWLDDQLSDDRNFLLGETPAAIDAQIYCVIWFLRGRWDKGAAFLSEFPPLNRWEENVKNAGHGDMSPMTPEEAISRAAASTPVTIDRLDDNDPQSLKPGMTVTIVADVDGGEQPVQGVISAVNTNTITLLGEQPDLGEVHIHFPRAGYRVMQMSGD